MAYSCKLASEAVFIIRGGELRYNTKELLSTVNGSRMLTSLLLSIFLIVSLSSTIILFTYPISDNDSNLTSKAANYLTTNSDEINLTQSWDKECSSVIVTGSAAKDGRPILMKNRDWPDSRPNRPFFVPATIQTYAYVGVNTNSMGINEKGLAVMNTAMPSLNPEPGYGNLVLNQKILERYESVYAVAIALNDTNSPIGPNSRSSFGGIATCVGVIDRFGGGAFFEVSDTKAYVEYIVDGYDTRANHPRIFPVLASGPSGRDQYLLDALDAVYAEKGVISCEDVMQDVSRYVRNKELGSSSFSIVGEACNENTVSAMVALSGDLRYDGKLNVMWGAYGYTPLVSVFVPSIAFAGYVPDSTSDLWSHTADKYESALVGTAELEPSRVREIQQYAFFAEDYSVEEYYRLMSSVPTDLSETDLQSTLSEFITRTDDYAAEVFIEESFHIEVPEPVSFSTSAATTTTNTTSTTTSIITTVTTTSTSSTNNITTGLIVPSPSSSLVVGFGIGGAMSIVMLLAYFKRYRE